MIDSSRLILREMIATDAPFILELLNDGDFYRYIGDRGIRTLELGQPRFNPMSYHNGSVWPHDTAMAAAGLAGVTMNYFTPAAIVRALAILRTGGRYFEVGDGEALGTALRTSVAAAEVPIEPEPMPEPELE